MILPLILADNANQKSLKQFPGFVWVTTIRIPAFGQIRVHPRKSAANFCRRYDKLKLIGQGLGRSPNSLIGSVRFLKHERDCAIGAFAKREEA